MSSAAHQRFLEALGDPKGLRGIEASGDLWPVMCVEARAKAEEEPILGSYFHATILNHQSFGSALSFRLASKLDNPMLPTMLIRDVIEEAIAADPDILCAAEIDILATCARDPRLRRPVHSVPVLQGFPRPAGLPHRPLAVGTGPQGPGAVLPVPDQRYPGGGHSSRSPVRRRHHARPRHRPGCRRNGGGRG